MRRDASKFSPLFEIARVLARLDHVVRFIVNAKHGVPIRLAKVARFFLNSAHYENDNSPIKKFNEPVAFARISSHRTNARLLWAFTAGASGYPRTGRRLF